MPLGAEVSTNRRRRTYCQSRYCNVKLDVDVDEGCLGVNVSLLLRAEPDSNSRSKARDEYEARAIAQYYDQTGSTDKSGAAVTSHLALRSCGNFEYKGAK